MGKLKIESQLRKELNATVLCKAGKQTLEEVYLKSNSRLNLVVTDGWTTIWIFEYENGTWSQDTNIFALNKRIVEKLNKLAKERAK